MSKSTYKKQAKRPLSPERWVFATLWPTAEGDELVVRMREKRGNQWITTGRLRILASQASEVINTMADALGLIITIQPDPIEETATKILEKWNINEEKPHTTLISQFGLEATSKAVERLITYRRLEISKTVWKPDGPIVYLRRIN